jgi:hypothetical protein
MPLAAMHSHPPQIVWWIVCVTPVMASIGALIWSIIMIRAWRRDLHRHRNGLCMRCGYDLRETGDRCPECGSPIIFR